MANFALLDENNVVTTILYIEDYLVSNENGNVDEQIGISYLSQHNSELGTNWIQTYPEKEGRKNSATIGGVFDSQRGAFIYEKPYNSWTLNEETCLWEAPVPKPENNVYARWNEEEQSWE